MMEEERASAANIFEQYRNLLFSIAYRMLGSRADAEDMVQETFIRWQQASLAPVHNPRSLWVTIISRLCINHLQSARIRREEYFGEWLPEPMITQRPDESWMAEARINASLSMAFLVMRQRLNPAERAVFLLREVFDYEYEEVAAILKLSQANCRQILRRARQHVAEMRPRRLRSAKNFSMRSSMQRRAAILIDWRRFFQTRSHFTRTAEEKALLYKTQFAAQ